MGLFSFITSDTQRSVLFCDSCQFGVYLIDNKNNHWYEKYYEGYGVFGGKDIFVLVAEMNNMDVKEENIEKNRLIGIDICWGNIKLENPIFPLLVEKICEWRNEKLKDCPYQGYHKYDHCPKSCDLCNEDGSYCAIEEDCDEFCVYCEK